MFGLGLIKGTIIGLGISLVSGLVLKEMCKLKKTNNSKGNADHNNNAS